MLFSYIPFKLFFSRRGYQVLFCMGIGKLYRSAIGISMLATGNLSIDFNRVTLFHQTIECDAGRRSIHRKHWLFHKKHTYRYPSNCRASCGCSHRVLRTYWFHRSRSSSYCQNNFKDFQSSQIGSRFIFIWSGSIPLLCIPGSITLR